MSANLQQSRDGDAIDLYLHSIVFSGTYRINVYFFFIGFTVYLQPLQGVRYDICSKRLHDEKKIAHLISSITAANPGSELDKDLGILFLQTVVKRFSLFSILISKTFTEV